MERFLYIAWFRNLQASEDDQNREWPACFMVEASDIDEALCWGNHLALQFSIRHNTESFLWSSIEAEAEADSDTSKLPRVCTGETPSDDYIGW